MDVNKIYNENCFDTMKRMLLDNQTVDIILTSPPYCTPNDDASKYTENRFNNYQVHYDVFTGFNSAEEYRSWSVELFKLYEKILSKNGVVIYNISYTSKTPDLVYLVLADIINNTNFMCADCISWKKNNALPQNMNKNRLTRVCEFVFIFCRKTEANTFKCNKVKSGTKYKNLHYNYIEAPNNDILDLDINKLNSATFSTTLVEKLLDIYAKSGDIVYDSFMGTGTTAVASLRHGCVYIGSELSKEQCEFANKRINCGITSLKKPKQKKLF